MSHPVPDPNFFKELVDRHLEKMIMIGTGTVLPISDQLPCPQSITLSSSCSSSAAHKRKASHIFPDPDPESGAFLTPESRDPGWVKNQDPDPG